MESVQISLTLVSKTLNILFFEFCQIKPKFEISKVYSIKLQRYRKFEFESSVSVALNIILSWIIVQWNNSIKRVKRVNGKPFGDKKAVCINLKSDHTVLSIRLDSNQHIYPYSGQLTQSDIYLILDNGIILIFYPCSPV